MIGKDIVLSKKLNKIIKRINKKINIYSIISISHKNIFGYNKIEIRFNYETKLFKHRDYLKKEVFKIKKIIIKHKLSSLYILYNTEKLILDYQYLKDNIVI